MSKDQYDGKYFAQFPFIRDDVELCALVSPKTGRQQLLMRKFNKHTGEVELFDSIDCIHTAICDIPVGEFEDRVNDENFEQDMLILRSSEFVKEIHLEPEEKFKAFKSWVAGIAEAGIEAFNIQAEIERVAQLSPISNRLMRFIARVDVNIMYDLITKIERECVFEGIHHEASMIANLDPILSSIIGLGSINKHILKAIISINPPIKLFTASPRNLIFLKYPEMCELEYFREFFRINNLRAKLFLAENPKAVFFDGYKNLFAFPNALLRKSIASNPNACKFDEFRRFLSYHSESSNSVREEAAKNPRAPIEFEEFQNFLSYKTEPEWLVRVEAMRNPNAKRFVNYKFFEKDTIAFIRSMKILPNSSEYIYILRDILDFVMERVDNNLIEQKYFEEQLIKNPIFKAILETQPSARIFNSNRKIIQLLTLPVVLEYVDPTSLFIFKKVLVRKILAGNPNAPNYSAYKTFLSQDTENSINVRLCAASNSNAVKFMEYRNFFSSTTENEERVRKRAAKNPNAVKFEEFKNFLSYETEPREDIREAAASNPKAPDLVEYENFLSTKTEPSEVVRYAAARNRNAFLKHENFHLLLDEKSEPIPRIRNRAEKTMKKKK